jgi:uncharacterized protein (TIGR02271 family)
MIRLDEVPQLMGVAVYGPDGSKIGSAGQVYLDDHTGEPEWVCVRTGLFGHKESFVPLSDAAFTGDRLEVPYDKDRVKGAPHVDPDGDLSPADEDELYTYYGVAASGGQAAGGTYDADTYDRAGYDRAGHDTVTDAGAGSVGHDTSGPTTDDAMTRSEERLNVGTRREQVGRVRLRKYIVTEQQQITVPVRHEEVRLERVPFTDRDVDQAMGGTDIGDAEQEIVLHAERPVVGTETVPVERVRLHKQTVTDQETVAGEVRKEQIELDDDTTTGRDPR